MAVASEATGHVAPPGIMDAWREIAGPRVAIKQHKQRHRVEVHLAEDHVLALLCITLKAEHHQARLEACARTATRCLAEDCHSRISDKRTPFGADLSQIGLPCSLNQEANAASSISLAASRVTICTTSTSGTVNCNPFSAMNR